jgi:hypothetical protein
MSEVKRQYEGAGEHEGLFGGEGERFSEALEEAEIGLELGDDGLHMFPVWFWRSLVGWGWFIHPRSGARVHCSELFWAPCNGLGVTG